PASTPTPGTGPGRPPPPARRRPFTWPSWNARSPRPTAHEGWPTTPRTRAAPPAAPRARAPRARAAPPRLAEARQGALEAARGQHERVAALEEEAAYLHPLGAPGAGVRAHPVSPRGRA